MNKENFFQFIIVGAGPGGSSAAYFLAEKGYSVALIDRKIHPRYKTCGGAVPIFTQKLFDFNIFDSINCVPVNAVYFTFKGKKDIYSTIETPALYGVDRGEFDAFLYNKAKEKGAATFPGELVTGVKEFDDRVEVTTKSGLNLKGKFLIGADGANSIVRSKLFADNFKNLKTATSLVWEIYNANREVFNKYQNCTHLDFGWHRNGYLGLIPKFDHLTAGAYAAKFIPADKAKAGLEKFCARLKINTDEFNPSIRYYFYYDRNRTLHRRRTLLIGDAACLVDALSGEGIKYAVTSGMIAGKILEYAVKLDFQLKEYSRIIHNMIGKELLLAQKMANLAFWFPAVTYDGMIRVCEDTSKILNGEMSYSVFVDRLKNKIKRKFFGFLKGAEKPQRHKGTEK